jgi:acetyl esterase/lipase
MAASPFSGKEPALRSIVFALVLLTLPAQSQLSETAEWSALIPDRFWVTPNITYATASGVECKLDVYRPAGSVSPVPIVIFIHGGGWVVGSKESAVLHVVPYLEMGFAVVNVEYRLAKVALAPAAVEDVRRALRWVWVNAKTYAFDTTKIIVTGGSAGGHLALMCGMLSPSAGFDQTTGWDPAAVTPKVAAIVNWYGITDVADLLDGPNYQQYAAAWLGSLPNRTELAKAVSPLTYVRKDIPPVFTVHGDADPLVPYQHAVRLHEGLKKAGVKNEFVTIPGGRHGGFSRDQTIMIHRRIRTFLREVGIEPK